MHNHQTPMTDMSKFSRHFTWTALTNAVLNAVVLVGMASMVVNNYTRHLHYLIIALEPKVLCQFRNEPKMSWFAEPFGTASF